MHRRDLLLTGLAAAGTGLAGCATPQAQPGGTYGGPPPPPGARDGQVGYGPDQAPYDGPPAPPMDAPAPPAQGYTREELVSGVSDYLGVTAESAGAAIQRVFAQYGEPTGYIAGEEAAGAVAIGARYGRGLLYMKGRPTTEVFWQGPSVGWDFGGNASRVFTLCYNLQYPDAIFRRFPGVEGSAYLIGGLGVNYQRADDITLAPVRAGVGVRLGANVGYLSYSRQRNLLPF